MSGREGDVPLAPASTSADAPWVLVLGGCTRPGNRRARRDVKTAVEHGFRAVWLDGFEEEVDGCRAPIADLAAGAEVRIVRLRAMDEASNRRTVRSRLARLIGSGSPGPRRKQLARSVKRLVQVGRGRRLRSIQMPIIDELAVSSRPDEVVYCDDLALATAWELSRRWPDVRIGSELVLDGDVG